MPDQCKGAHSWVRKTLGINMDGEQSSEDSEIYYSEYIIDKTSLQ